MAKRKPPSRHLIPRIFRSAARTLLAAGTILAAGSIAMLIFYFTNDQTLPVSTASPDSPATIPVSSSVQTTYLIWSIIIIAIVVIGMIFVFQRLNAFVRRCIDSIAKFLRISIFATEIYITFVVWSISVILLSFFLPPKISLIFAGALFTLTEYFFIMAWALYGCKKYKI